MEKNKIQQLTKSYQKRFKTLADNSINEDFGIECFVEHLKFIRDRLIIEHLDTLEEEPIKTKIAILNTTIIEFNAYQESLTPEQKLFHWTTFCDFVKLYKSEELDTHDSI